MTIQWRPIPDTNDIYEASSDGRIRSVDRRTAKGFRKGVVLKAQINASNRYPYVRIMIGGRLQTKSVHSLVMASFVGVRPSGMEVRHLNGVRTDASLSNLAYGTSSENMQDTLDHGHHYWASRTHCKRGHEFTPENTYVNERSRSCRTCARERNRAYEARLRMKRVADVSDDGVHINRWEPDAGDVA